MSDTIDRQAAIEAIVNTVSEIGLHDNSEVARYGATFRQHEIIDIIEGMPSAQPDLDEWCTDCSEYDQERHCCPRWNRVIRQTLKDAQPERKTGEWIPCSERLPEEDMEVLISYRAKEGKGDTSHVYIDITSYGQMYFGGNKVGDYKHWRAPFEYFESNYEVVAWMPLPEPYKGEEA